MFEILQIIGALALVVSVAFDAPAPPAPQETPAITQPVDRAR